MNKQLEEKMREMAEKSDELAAELIAAHRADGGAFSDLKDADFVRAGIVKGFRARDSIADVPTESDEEARCAECGGKFKGSFIEFWNHRNSVKVPWSDLRDEELKAYRAYITGVSRGIAIERDTRAHERAKKDELLERAIGVIRSIVGHEPFEGSLEPRKASEFLADYQARNAK